MHSVFHSPTHGRIDLATVIHRISDFVLADATQPYRIAVGADSAARSPTAITTVVIVHRVGSGAMYAYSRGPLQRYASLRDRIYAETMSAITLGQEIRSGLRDRFGATDALHETIEIHADVGYNGPMHAEVESIMGMAKGFNFIPVVKPEAIAASSVADRHA